MAPEKPPPTDNGPMLKGSEATAQPSDVEQATRPQRETKLTPKMEAYKVEKLEKR